MLHGHATLKGNSPTYTTWNTMIQRCTNPKCTKFYMYGGAGITVCERWRSFVNFLADMGERPTGKTLDRKNGKLGYYKENCKWSTLVEQQRNMKNNHWITLDGETKCLTEWCQIYGIDNLVVSSRIRYGWPVERLFDPVHKPNITREVIKDLRRVRESTGLSYEKLGDMFGISMTTAYRICKESDYYIPAGGEQYRRGRKLELKKLTPEVLNEIRTLRENSKISYAGLGKMFGIAYGTARRVCIGERV